MTTQEALKIYREKIGQMRALRHAMGVMQLDAATAAPAESAEGRGKTLAYLSGCDYQIETGPELLEAARFLEAHKEELDPQDRREIEDAWDAIDFHDIPDDVAARFGLSDEDIETL